MNAFAPAPPPHLGPTQQASFRLLTAIDEVRALAGAWQELLDASASREPTLTPDWLLTWWDVYGAGRRLAVGVWSEGQRLLGLAPLCRARAWHKPGIPFRRLEWLGSDVPEEDGVCSDFLSLVVRGGSEERIAGDFVQAVVAGTFGAWDECVLGRMDGGNPLTQYLTRAFTQAGFCVETTQQDVAPYLALAPSWDDFLRGLPKRKRQGLNAALRHLDKWAGAFTLERAQNDEQLATGMQILADLHRERWGEAGGGAFSPRFRRFHERYARRLLERGDLELAWLVAQGQPVAATYAFVHHGKMCFYQCGRTLGVPPAVRLGIVMVIFALQRAWARGLREFDFLAGHDAYKREFTDQARPIVSLRIARRGWRELLRGGAPRGKCGAV